MGSPNIKENGLEEFNLSLFRPPLNPLTIHKVVILWNYGDSGKSKNYAKTIPISLSSILPSFNTIPFSNHTYILEIRSQPLDFEQIMMVMIIYHDYVYNHNFYN